MYFISNNPIKQNADLTAIYGEEGERKMYRQYNNPYELEKELKKAKERLARLQAENADEDSILSAYEDVQILEEKVNFAWQDDEEGEI